MDEEIIEIIRSISSSSDVDTESFWKREVDDDKPATAPTSLLSSMEKISKTKQDDYVTGDSRNGLRFNKKNGTCEQPWKYYTLPGQQFAILVEVDDEGFLHCQACSDTLQRRPCRFAQAYG